MRSSLVEKRSGPRSVGVLILLGRVSHRPLSTKNDRRICRCFPLACQANHLAQITRPREASSKENGELRHE
jgi:hypothetical protein